MGIMASFILFLSPNSHYITTFPSCSSSDHQYVGKYVFGTRVKHNDNKWNLIFSQTFFIYLIYNIPHGYPSFNNNNRI